MKRRHRPHLRGLTLVELMVGMVISLFILAAAFTFAGHQIRLTEFTAGEVDRDRMGRLALELMAEDLRNAGLGVG